MSKAKYHAPTRGGRHPKKEKSGKSKSKLKSNTRAPICISPQHEEEKAETRQWLKKNETPKLRGRFYAFEETLYKLAMKFAPDGPPYQRRTISAEDVAEHVRWVFNFKGVMVKREFLDMGHKKGKAWADQHRAQYLGETFFVDLLRQLERFIEKYAQYIPSDLSLDKFRCECIVGVLKRTFSPEHNQAGDTLLICDQAVKSGPTRRQLKRLVDGLIDMTRLKKGRDVVNKLEQVLYDDENDGDDENEKDADGDVDVSDNHSSSSSSGGDQSRQSPLMELAEEAHSVAASVSSEEVVALRQADWNSFPISGPQVYAASVPRTQSERESAFLRAENRRLREELNRARSQLAARDAGFFQPPPQILDFHMPLSGYGGNDFGRDDMGAEYGDNYVDQHGFNWNPQPVIASAVQYW